MKEKITVQETECAFCGKTTYWNDTKEHHDSCLTKKLKHILRSEIIE